MSAEMLAVELVTIGDELLLGETVDGNGPWLGRALAAAGIRVSRRATVADDDAAIRDAVGAALARAGVVICTGGLGPTPDDVTRPAVASLFGRPLVVDPEILDGIRRAFEARGLPMPEVNRKQAEVPVGATVFRNPRGTAPGLALEDAAGRAVILLPGVPAEMRALVDEQVLPYLARRWPRRPHPVLHRLLRTTGIAESALSEQIDDLTTLRPLTVAFLPGTAGVDLRVTSWGTLDATDARRALDAADAALCQRIGRYVYGRDDDDLAALVGRELTARGGTLALAESCTGGLVAKRLTDTPGASAFFLVAVVAYADAAKESFLGVERSTLDAHGAVSEETARAMADGIRRAASADLALSVTGIAGPGGGSPEKPVGTVWIGIADPDGLDAYRFRFTGDRENVRERAAQAALACLWNRLRTGAR